MTKQLTVLIQAPDQATEMELCQALQTDPRLLIIGVSRTSQRIYEEAKRLQPMVVVLMLEAQQRAPWALCQKLRQAVPGLKIICASRLTSPDLILDTLRNGADDFLRLPVISHELCTVVDHIAEKQQSIVSQPPKRGRVIAVFSPSGGCGSFFIAANLAVGINASTVLLDLNLQGSSQDLFLGLQPRYSWVDLIDKLAILDESVLDCLLVRYSEKLALLAAPPKVEEVPDATREQIHAAIVALRGQFDYVVLDLMHTFNNQTLSALDTADEIVLVVGPDISAARAAKRTLSIFESLGYPREKVHIVLNRWNEQRKLDFYSFERLMGHPIKCQIADDYTTAVATLNSGQPLLATPNTSALANGLRKLLTLCNLPTVEQLQLQPTRSKRGLLTFWRRPTVSLAAANGRKTTQRLTNDKLLCTTGINHVPRKTSVISIQMQ